MATYVHTGGNYKASENTMNLITDTGTTVHRVIVDFLCSVDPRGGAV
jgi:hypothetical protein